MRVKTTTIDTYSQKNKIEPDLIKIDVEGHERAVLHGGTKVISKNLPTILIEYIPALNNDIGLMLEDVAKHYKTVFIVDEIKGKVYEADYSSLNTHSDYNLIISNNSSHLKIIRKFVN